jgi:hypothetical protein
MNNNYIAKKLKNYKYEDFEKFINFSSSALSYGYITNNAQQYIRDLEVAKLLGEKFSRSGIYTNAQNAQNWLNQRLEVNPNNLNLIFNRIQGEGGGEVDVIRAINGSLKGLLYKAEYATNNLGNITNNVPGIDAIIKNRFTGKIVEQIQIKSNWSTDSSVLKQTVSNFLKNENYNENIVLSGPKELIKIAKDMNIKNPTYTFGDINKNKESAERLIKTINKGKFSSNINFSGVAEKVGKGALIGAAVTISVSAISNYIAYRNGQISMNEAFNNIAIDGSKGAIIGGSLAGLALVFPPGVIGIGIGIVIGTGIRQIIEIAYGKGEYKKILDEINTTNNLIFGLTHFALTTDKALEMQKQFVDEMVKIEKTSILLNTINDKIDDELEENLRRFRK